MALCITAFSRIRLARGAAVLVLGGLAAGCSSGASSLTDGLVTNTTSSTRPVAVAQANQPYPGDNGQRVVRPQMPVGNGVAATGAPPPAALPAPSGAAAPSYPAAGQQSAVTAAPLPPPQNAQSQSPVLAPVAVEPQRASDAPSTSTAAASSSSQESSRPAESAQPGGSYTVASGDTLYAISRRTGASVDSIRRANGLSGDAIQVGQRLAIPGSGATTNDNNGTQVAAAPAPSPSPEPDPVTTSSADASASTARASEAQQEPRVGTYTPPSGGSETVEQAQSTDMAALPPDATGVGRLRWPVRGRVVAGFGADSGGRANDGIDIAVPEGTSVRAAENGVVIYAGDGLRGFGNTVLVRHEDGLVTVYGHTSEFKVRRGDNVRRGQEIALSGMSGDADRPKLHFEVRQGTEPVDPMGYLE